MPRCPQFGRYRGNSGHGADSAFRSRQIESQIAIQNQAIAIAAKHREQHALAATLGEATAISEVKHARSKQREAESQLEDLNLALPEARLHLQSAERAATTARAELSKFHSEVLMRQRIDVAGQLDDVIANFTRLYREYEKLGREIVNTPGTLPQTMLGTTDHESAMGARRVRAALSACFQGFYLGAHHDEQKKITAGDDRGALLEFSAGGNHDEGRMNTHSTDLLRESARAVDTYPAGRAT